MDDRFIGYRGSQENEWSWEPGRTKHPKRTGALGGRKLALAVLSAFALVTVVAAAVYMVVGDGGNGDGPAVIVTSTPPGRPTASPTARPTQAPTTPAPTATHTPGPSPTPAPPALGAELLLWNSSTGKWQQDSLTPGASEYSEGDTIPFLFRLWNVEAGQQYEFAIHYFDCGLLPERSFDTLAPTDSSGDAFRLLAPGPGRVRPDSQVPVPVGTAGSGAEAVTAYLAAWGGTFQQAPEWSPITSTCEGDRSLTFRVLAQSTALYIEWGGHLASKVDWPNGGAATAKAPFGMSAGLQGVDATQIQILPGAITN